MSSRFRSGIRGWPGLTPPTDAIGFIPESSSLLLDPESSVPGFALHDFVAGPTCCKALPPKTYPAIPNQASDLGVMGGPQVPNLKR